MHISENTFKVLTCLLENKKYTQRELSNRTALSLGSINKSLKQLKIKELVSDSLTITPKGIQALEPYKVDNAIIMAAGLSSRFAPISYEHPKGTLKVRGEVLIERQIKQLIEAGITDITVVVGYKKEEFLYLKELFNVDIVVNEEYLTHNNNSSLYCVKDRLMNTYICSSDNYFTENVFTPYVYRSYYASQYIEGKTEEWCIREGAHRNIAGVTIGGTDSWIMLGHAFFDRSFSKQFVEILESEYNKPETADKLWEQIYLEHVEKLPMSIKRYEKGIINEFDSLNELRVFDPEFIENVDSEAFDNISTVLNCSRKSITDFRPLKQGITNLSCYFKAGEGEYVYRHPGVGTNKLIDRKAEVEALEIARSLNIDDTFIYEDSESGWKISKYIPNAKNLDINDDSQLKKAMSLLRKLHSANSQMNRSFDYYEESLKYESDLTKSGPIKIKGYAELRRKITLLNKYVKNDRWKKVLSHNDFFHLNILIDEDNKMRLIDWEYAGMSDPANDFGTFVVSSELDIQTAEKLLEYYFSRPPTSEEKRHFFAHIALAGWCWYVWSLSKENSGDNVGRWLFVYYSYAVDFLDRILNEYSNGIVHAN